MSGPRGAVWVPSLLCLLLLAGCAATADSAYEEPEPYMLVEALATEQAQSQASGEEVSLEVEGEVPLAVAESGADKLPTEELADVTIEAELPGRDEVIRTLVVEAETLLRDVPLEYLFTGKGKKETLRGRPVVFALWSETRQDWTLAHVEIPRPPVNWKPGRKPLPFVMRTPGIDARHVKGTGAERLMFSFSREGEPLKVYGRKFPVFDSALIKKKRWREVVDKAQPIVYLPFTEDTFDPLLVAAGRNFLQDTAQQAVDELRAAQVPSAAYPGMLLADVVPTRLITALAVIEQTDDAEYTNRGAEAFNQVLSQYGLKREEAYRYSVSSASALGPMQFTNRKGNGTYALVVRRCPRARIDPDFERGATNLLNAMKAAICLLDIELAQMRKDIREAYQDNPMVLGIFPVAAYNGGPRNVTRLYNVVKRAKVALAELSRVGEQPLDKPVTCPCLWKQDARGIRPVALPRYNNENRWYIEKYQSLLALVE
ncbi:MAG TPA: hypothetical protein VNQ32_07125 [Steroidobacteraceae bacterium]|nr:hypothetical protein [Steroidobacteraceae bacterium]